MTARTVLDGIRQQLAAATPGPWETMKSGLLGTRVVSVDGEWGGLVPDEFVTLVTPALRKPTDASFIAAAPGNIERLTAALEAVLALHTPVKKWEPYAEAGYSFNTREEALRAAGEEDLGRIAIEEGPQYFEVCKECGRVESDQLSEIGEEWGYRESLWPCPTVAAVEAALTKDGQ
ncbi:hypothetical protein QE394_001120 [Arthrobacter sp. SORGH_AS 212]|uniref:hypothetical protein n=1 Tax=Pseudarthrobacter sp. SORGH_AS 212 TaxID=3041777 RepID=UPI0027810914|nr:hypothetical protein [Arthrobacter sp. SORGH_AS_0212]